jgi:hypothetical protein
MNIWDTKRLTRFSLFFVAESNIAGGGGGDVDKDGTNEKESENTFYLVSEVYHNLYVLV